MHSIVKELGLVAGLESMYVDMRGDVNLESGDHE